MSAPDDHGESDEVRPGTTGQDVYEAGSWPDRRWILLLLAVSPRVVRDLVTVLGSNMSHVSNHLAILREAGLVRYVRVKRDHLYSLTAATRLVAGVDGLTYTLRAGDGSVLRFDERITYSMRRFDFVRQAWITLRSRQQVQAAPRQDGSRSSIAGRTSLDEGEADHFVPRGKGDPQLHDDLQRSANRDLNHLGRGSDPQACAPTGPPGAARSSDGKSGVRQPLTERNSTAE